jgi:adenylate cyclase
LIVGPKISFRNDVFVSYSKKTEREISTTIVAALEAVGYKVWWDTNLISGDEFSDVIRRELVGSRAVLVIWTPVSVKSRWVKAEAMMADIDEKLVPVRPRNLDPREIPLPFNVHHCEFTDDHAALIKALKKKGILPGGAVMTA